MLNINFYHNKEFIFSVFTYNKIYFSGVNISMIRKNIQTIIASI